MRRFALLLVLALLTGCGGKGASTAPSVASRFDAQRAFRDLRAQVEIGARPAGSAASGEEVRFIARRLRQAGVEYVRIQHPHLNVVGRIPGGRPGTVVAGAHHDTKEIPGFVGANDGASGVAVLLELARELPGRLDGPSLDLVFFDAEEPRGDRPFDLDGARGSGQFVRYARRGGRQGSPPLRQIRAMVLLDLVGDCQLQIPREANSDPGLWLKLRAAARRVGAGAVFPSRTGGSVLDDHIPFLDAGVPAIDLIDFSFPCFHRRCDDMSAVSERSVDAVGETVYELLRTL
jgi:hypothetical protein